MKKEKSKKNSTKKILKVQSEVKKKNIGLSIQRGGDSGFLVYSNTPPTPNQWPFPLIETTPTNNPPSGSESVVLDHGWRGRNLGRGRNPGLGRTEPWTGAKPWDVGMEPHAATRTWKWGVHMMDDWSTEAEGGS